MSEDITANDQRAAAGSEAIRAYTRTSDPRYIQDRLARLLCDLRHYADRISGLRFDEVLDRARKAYESQGAGSISMAPESAAIRAFEIHDHHALGRQLDGSGSPDALADLRQYADAHGISLEEAAARLSEALVTELRHYAHDQGVDFAEALADGERAYTEQRLQEEGPFQPGRNTRPGAFLEAGADAPPFHPFATRQGVVTSINDAEWLLVRTAARVHVLERRDSVDLALPADLSDRRALADALVDACGLTPVELLGELEPLIRERADIIEQGVEDAARLGREHGLDGTEPYCRLDEDGHDSRLMNAFGETEAATDANVMHRLALIKAYTTAYRDARKQAGVQPSQLAESDFPQEVSGSAACVDPLDAADRTKAAPRAESRHPRQRL